MYNIGSEKWAGLSKLMEECGEVVQVAAKIIATNGVYEHWDGSFLPDRMEEELADLMAAMHFFMLHNSVLRPKVIGTRKDKKLELFEKWHKEGVQ